MILNNKKHLIASSLVTLLPIAVGLVLWNRFPETMAIHFGLTGQADGFASPSYAVFVPPVVMLAAHWLCILATRLDKRNQNRNQKVQTLVLWIIPLLSNLSCCGIYALALGWEFSPVAWTMVPMGIVFAITGNYLPKTRMNATIGIKIPTTYSSEENWNATHRFAGRLWLFGGILIAGLGFLPNLWAVTALFVIIAVIVLVPMVYSWQYYRKEKAQGKALNTYTQTVGPKTRAVSLVMLLVLLVFVLFVLFWGQMDFDFQADRLVIDADMYTDYTVFYDTIDSVEFREGNIPGLRVGGFGSFRLLMGWFENEEFGTYMRYTYYQPDACVVLTVSGKPLVLSGADRSQTQALYEMLLTKIQ